MRRITTVDQAAHTQLERTLSTTQLKVTRSRSVLSRQSSVPAGQQRALQQERGALTLYLERLSRVEPGKTDFRDALVELCRRDIAQHAAYLIQMGITETLLAMLRQIIQKDVVKNLSLRERENRYIIHSVKLKTLDEVVLLHASSVIITELAKNKTVAVRMREEGLLEEIIMFIMTKNKLPTGACRYPHRAVSRTKSRELVIESVDVFVISAITAIMRQDYEARELVRDTLSIARFIAHAHRRLRQVARRPGAVLTEAYTQLLSTLFTDESAQEVLGPALGELTRPLLAVITRVLQEPQLGEAAGLIHLQPAPRAYSLTLLTSLAVRHAAARHLPAPGSPVVKMAKGHVTNAAELAALQKEYDLRPRAAKVRGDETSQRIELLQQYILHGVYGLSCEIMQELEKRKGITRHLSSVCCCFSK